MAQGNPFTNPRPAPQTRSTVAVPGQISPQLAAQSAAHAEAIHAEVNAERGEDAPTRGPRTVLKAAKPMDVEARVKALVTSGCPESFARQLATEEQRSAAGSGTISVAVSAKGAASVYGLGRFPVTLYASQWSKLLDSADGLRAWLEANADSLATKG